MVVANSYYVIDVHAQKNGKRYVTEYRTLIDGTELPPLIYGPMEDGTNYQAIMDARTLVIEEQLVEKEAETQWL